MDANNERKIDEVVSDLDNLITTAGNGSGGRRRLARSEEITKALQDASDAADAPANLFYSEMSCVRMAEGGPPQRTPIARVHFGCLDAAEHRSVIRTSFFPSHEGRTANRSEIDLRTDTGINDARQNGADGADHRE